MARPYLYHVWHLPSFDALPPFSSVDINCPRLSGRSTETKTVYSLKKDMEELRRIGRTKGIVDDSIVRVGVSTENLDLWALKVGTGDSHKVLFTGDHHAREWISVEIAYLAAEYLILNYVDPPTNEKEKRIKHLLMNRQIWFVPMVNPDGHRITITANRSWRPNNKSYDLPARTFEAEDIDGNRRTISHPAGVFTGVDINRNYGTNTWGKETFHRGHAMSSADPRDSGPNSVWFGPSANSEAEGAVIAALMRRENYRSSITYHSYSQLLLYPDRAAGDAYVQAVGHGMNDLIAERGNPYSYETGSALYPTTGDLMDFSYQISPARPTYTIELRPRHPPASRSHVFSGLPESEIEPCFKENLPAALALINSAGFDVQPDRDSCNVQVAAATLCQAVRNCWEVFQGWVP